MDWPFSDPPNVATFTVQDIVDDGATILLVCHDAEDGTWQFLTGFAVTMDRALLVTLDSILAIDPSIYELADLPLGWVAKRTAAGQPWEKSPAP